jgi:hypothetical protein
MNRLRTILASHGLLFYIDAFRAIANAMAAGYDFVNQFPQSPRQVRDELHRPGDTRSWKNILARLLTMLTDQRGFDNRDGCP